MLTIYSGANKAPNITFTYTPANLLHVQTAPVQALEGPTRMAQNKALNSAHPAEQLTPRIPAAVCVFTCVCVCMYVFVHTGKKAPNSTDTVE